MTRSRTGYSRADHERWVPEPPKRPGRTAFARDRARVLHSAGFRRLAAKTQVHLAGESDFPRTRLTHSLEVAQIARELGAALGADPDLAEVAGLAHDLGHPPFGHNGEAALDRACAHIGGFEGNAQTLRVLTRLEAKIARADGSSAGLNLTRAAIDSILKYPWPRAAGNAKFSCYQSDAEVFGWVRRGVPAGRACFEAQIMDWSDDVAYSVHDIEDAVHDGQLDLRLLDVPAQLAEVVRVARGEYLPGAADDELVAAAGRVTSLDCWPRGFDGSPRDLARLKAATSVLIGRFVTGALEATRLAYGRGPLTRYRADLIVPGEQRAEVAVLKATASWFVFQRDDVQPRYERQRAVLAELVEVLGRSGPDALDPFFRPAWLQAGSDDERLRVLIDQVASLTDTSAVLRLEQLSAGRSGAARVR